MMILKVLVAMFLLLTPFAHKGAYAADGFGGVGEQGVYFNDQDHPALDSSMIDAAELSQMEPAAGGDMGGTGVAPSGINSQLIEHYFGEALNGFGRDSETVNAPSAD